MFTSTKQLNPRKISNALRVISIWYVLRDDLQKIIKRKNVAIGCVDFLIEQNLFCQHQAHDYSLSFFFVYLGCVLSPKCAMHRLIMG